MFKDSISIETILEILLAGGIVVLGTWYLNRPFLTEYFPFIAADAASLDMGNKLGGKVLIFLIISLFVGSTIIHAFDGVVPLLIGRKKHSSFSKRFIYYGFRVFQPISASDPRVDAIERYLSSDRKSWFLKVAIDWAHTNEAKLQSQEEKIRVHQHLVTRLRTLSADARSVLDSYYANFSFAGTLFIATLSLVPISLLAFATQEAVSKIKVYSNPQLIGFVVIAYFLQLLCGYLLKRRMRSFYHQAVTLSLHYYDVSKSKALVETTV